MVVEPDVDYCKTCRPGARAPGEMLDILKVRGFDEDAYWNAIMNLSEEELQKVHPARFLREGEDDSVLREVISDLHGLHPDDVDDELDVLPYYSADEREMFDEGGDYVAEIGE
jgi:hypothetical protein